MTIDQAYRLVQLIFNKNQQGNITPADFNNAAIIAQISIINEILGNEQEYQPGRPVPRYGLGISQKVMEDLRPLIKIPTALVFTAGVATYPTDSLYLYDLTVTTDLTQVKPCELDEFRILNKSVIKPPTAAYPWYYVLGANMYIGPSSIINTLVSYVRLPVAPNWNYTIVNSTPVYSASGSQDFELGPLLHLRIVCRMLQFFGLNLGLSDVVSAASILEQQGA